MSYINTNYKAALSHFRHTSHYEPLENMWRVKPCHEFYITTCSFIKTTWRAKWNSNVLIEIIEVARMWKQIHKQCQLNKRVSANVEVNHSHDTEAPKASRHTALFSKLPSRWVYAHGLIKNVGWNGVCTLIFAFLKLKSRKINKLHHFQIFLINKNVIRLQKMIWLIKALHRMLLWN